VEALKKAGVSCLRYPGGHVVSFWDWEFPYHETYANFWDPAYVRSLTPEKKAELKKQNGNRMLLDDYFRICAEGDFEPIVGINMFQGYKFDRLKDSVAKAVRLVDYCKKRTPKVTYYYLDNEAGHQPKNGKHVPVKDYIDLIPAYSKAIKKVQPDAKLIVNTIGWKGVKEMIGESGKYFDVLDQHWYYYNGQWGRFNVKSWRKETRHAKFENRTSMFDALTKAGGNQHLKLALLEWNLGPATGVGNSDKGTALWLGLVQADMFMSFMERGVSMAACWPLTWSRPKDKKVGFRRDFIDPATGEASPSEHIFKWFSVAADGALLNCSSPSRSGLHATAVMHKDGKTILVYVLNKSEEPRSVSVKFRNTVSAVSARVFRKGDGVGDAGVMDLPTRGGGQTVSFKMTDTSLVFLKLR
ncbi:unnamed protein product, partial [marine sediment metagenome]